MVMTYGMTDIGMSGLIRSIYDAALDVTRWGEFLSRFAAEFNSQQTIVFGQDFSDRSVEVLQVPSAAFTAYHGIGGDFLHSFATHYCRVNVWTEDERLHHEGQVVNGSKVYSDDRLPYTEWYGDWLQPQDMFYTLAAVVEKRAQRSLNVTAVRSKRCGAYTADEEARLQSLVPHLQTAFAMHRRLHRAEALAHASLSVLEGLPMGMILFGENGQLLHANARAHAFARDSGLLKISELSGLRATAHKDDLQLQAALRSVTATPSGGAPSAGHGLRLRNLAGDELHVMVTPFPHWSEPFGTRACCAVFLSNPGTPLPSLEGQLRSLYGLTPAEARLAQSLVNGLSLQEYAQQQALSVHTVRTQLRNMSVKVGVGRQADFVRTILTGPAVMRSGALAPPTPASPSSAG
jgi:DNA-binding CsgD family transcriptional regulator